MKPVAFLFLALLAPLGHADVISSFDLDDEGWTTATVNPLNLQTLSTGRPIWNAGHIEATEFSTIPNDLFALVGPAKFLGDKSAYYGGKVRYRLSDATRDGAAYPNLLLRGDGIALAYVTPPPASGGSGFAFDLVETSWITFTGAPATPAQFKRVLAKLDTFGINADWTTGGQDRVALDDVRMTAPVPEPATLAVLGLGFAGLARRRSVSRRSVLRP